MLLMSRHPFPLDSSVMFASIRHFCHRVQKKQKKNSEINRLLPFSFVFSTATTFQFEMK